MSSSSVGMGCIEVRKLTYAPNDAPILTVAQFQFSLDGGARTAYNNASGIARFENVSAGVHTVTEQVPAPWIQTLVSPVGGVVNVQAGSSCAVVEFRNKQTLGQTAAFSISKTDGRSTAVPGDTLIYTITVTNVSGSDATNVEVKDTISNLTSFIDALDGGTFNGASEVRWVIPSIPANQSRTVSFRARVVQNAANAAVIRNVAQVTGANGTATAEDTTVVQNGSVTSCPVDIQITDDPDPVEPGEELEYTLRIRNLSGADCRVDVTQILDDQTEFDDASDDGDEDDGVIEWDNVRVEAYDTTTLTSNVFVDDDAEDGDKLTSVAIAGSASDEETTKVEDNGGGHSKKSAGNGDIDVTKEASQSEVFPGGTVEYTVTVENTGDDDLEDIEVTDEMSNASGLILIDDGGSDGALGHLTWKISSLASGKTKVFRYRVIVDGSAPVGQRYVNDVTAETDDADDSASATVTVIGSLPQTGFGMGGRGRSSFLSPYGGESGGIPAAAVITVIGMGLSAGAAGARKWLTGF